MTKRTTKNARPDVRGAAPVPDDGTAVQMISPHDNKDISRQRIGHPGRSYLFARSLRYYGRPSERETIPGRQGKNLLFPVKQVNQSINSLFFDLNHF